MWLIMRRLRFPSATLSGVVFSRAWARGSYTGRQPRLTMLNGKLRSWPMRGSTTM